ncbi:MAG: fibronectin type III domain-containing protein [Nitrospirae bacterium]|nr:fibronectin type III domain-containing protein [Nitrospirota bacterium]
MNWMGSFFRRILFFLAVFTLVACAGCGGENGGIGNLGGGGNDTGGGSESSDPSTLSWDRNTQPDLAGYKIYYGTTSGDYTASKDVGLTNTPSYPKYPVADISSLSKGEKYYFVVTAYDTVGNESDYSNEVYTIIP